MPERSYADIPGSFRRGRAGEMARRGDFDAAASIVAADPAMAESYAARGGLQERRTLADRDRQYGQSYASAVAGGNYEQAAAMAGKHGDVQGVTGARAAQADITQQQRVEAWRELQSYGQQMEALAQSEDPQGGYEAMLARAEAESADSPELVAELRRFPRDYQSASRVVPGVIRTWQNRLLTPEQAMEMELTGRRLDIQDRQADVAARRADAAETTAQAALARAERGGGGFGPSGLTGDQVRAEREFSRDWRGVYNNFSEIRDSYQRIQTASAQGNAAGDLALVVAFTKLLDPGSVAREGEVALTQSAASALAQAQNFMPRLMQGNTLLPQQVRAQLVATAREMYGNYDRAYNRLASDYGRTADSYGFDRSRVMMGYDQTGGDETLPPAAQRVVGQVYTMPDGGRGRWNGPGQGFTPVEE